MAMVNMKRVMKDSAMTEAPAMAEEPSYPYGLCIRLEKDELEKLGIKELPGIGQYFMLEGKCVVKSVSAGASENREHASVELQLTHLSVEKMKDEKKEHDPTETAKMMYSGKMKK